MLDLERFAAGVGDYIRKACEPLAARIDTLEQRTPVPGPKGDRGENGKDGVDGKDGRDGVDGKDADSEAIFARVRSWLDNYFSECPPVRHGKDGVDGKDGRDGVDGKSVTIDDLAPLFEGWMAKFELAFERRAMEILQRAVDRLPKPADGKDGAPGRDALSIEDFDLDLSDDERTLAVSLICGSTRVTKSVRLSHMVHRGVWRQGHYLKGDCVSFGGSSWIATRDTDSKPETDDSWRLIVKRGRDGKGA